MFVALRNWLNVPQVSFFRPYCSHEVTKLCASPNREFEHDVRKRPVTLSKSAQFLLFGDISDQSFSTGTGARQGPVTWPLMVTTVLSSYLHLICNGRCLRRYSRAAVTLQECAAFFYKPPMEEAWGWTLRCIPHQSLPLLYNFVGFIPFIFWIASIDSYLPVPWRTITPLFYVSLKTIAIYP